MIADLEDWIFTKKLSPGSFIGRIDPGLYYGGEEFSISLSTVYRYINKGIISVDFADLIHKLNRKPRKKRVVKSALYPYSDTVHKAHIVYSPTKYKWVVSDKFKQ